MEIDAVNTRKEARDYAQHLIDTQKAWLMAELQACLDRQVKWPFISNCLAPLALALNRITAQEAQALTGDWSLNWPIIQPLLTKLLTFLGRV